MNFYKYLNKIKNKDFTLIDGKNDFAINHFSDSFYFLYYRNDIRYVKVYSDEDIGKLIKRCYLIFHRNKYNDFKYSWEVFTDGKGKKSWLSILFFTTRDKYARFD